MELTFDNSGQLVFDLFPDRVDPLREVVRRASPYWTTSRKKIIDLVEDGARIDVLTKTIKEEYCPYGYAGHYGADGLVLGWDMKHRGIKVIYQDHTEEQFTYREFAKTIRAMILCGEYSEKQE